ncbi:hypothetical protein [Gracilibacillus boraciitolerans]|uniref:hypothetical protein n=1 Tax=Gracilibacillus boraciitolerans TaxID=307521 RepID=UPI001F1E88D8|nr:hypothetical protein [Gracilibacillus boraciitolerans]
MEESIIFTIESWYVLVPVLLLGMVWLIIWAKRQNGNISLAQFVILISFGIYLLCVIHLVFFPIDVNIGQFANQTPWYNTINFIPILTIDVESFLLNIIMFIPLGCISHF